MNNKSTRRPITNAARASLFCALLLALSGLPGARAQGGRSQPPRGARSSSSMSVELPTPVAETPVPFEDDRPGRRVQTLSFTTPDATFERRVVKNAPFSAESVTEHAQALQDGNRMVRKSSARLFRDSAGRTRREHTLTRGGDALAPDGQPPRLIVITDPVDEIDYQIDTRAQTTRRQEVPPGARKARERAMGGGGGGAPFSVLMPTSAPRRRAAGEEGVPLPEPKREKLERQIIEGVSAEGTRTTVTIPAGEFDNEREMEITHEEWYSPELKMIVLMRHADPRFGETTFRLTNVSRGEQDGALFLPPAGYKVVHPAGPRGLPGRGLPPPNMIPPHRRP